MSVSAEEWLNRVNTFADAQFFNSIVASARDTKKTKTKTNNKILTISFDMR